jgi:hypothetical protein
MFAIGVNRANRATRVKSGKQDQANHSVQTLVFFICFNIYRIAHQKEKIASVRIIAFIARAIPLFRVLLCTRLMSYRCRTDRLVVCIICATLRFYI